MSCWVYFGLIYAEPAHGTENEAETGRLPGVDTAIFRVPSGTAPGHRGYGSGSVWVVGNGGYSWTLTVSDIYGVYLYFDATGLGSNYPVHRASGLQLRCLSE